MIFAIIIVIVINVIKNNAIIPEKKTNSVFINFINPAHIRNVANKYITPFIKTGMRYEIRLRW